VWEPTIAAMELQQGAGHRYLALDAPGCGLKRDRETADMTFEEVSRELVADVAAAGMNDVVLVGHSQAGMTMPQMALFAPQLFSRLIYVTCSAPLVGMTTLDQMGEGRHGENPEQVGWPVDPDTPMIERFGAMFCNDMDEKGREEFLEQLGKDMWPACCYTFSDWPYDHLRAIPSSYVLCLQDTSLPPEWQLRFSDRLHARRILRLDAGHQAMVTRPQALAEILLAEAART
jgi:pimeloyl-ACP methyl ester carboxylesterase